MCGTRFTFGGVGTCLPGVEKFLCTACIVGCMAGLNCLGFMMLGVLLVCCFGGIFLSEVPRRKRIRYFVFVLPSYMRKVAKTLLRDRLLGERAANIFLHPARRTALFSTLLVVHRCLKGVALRSDAGDPRYFAARREHFLLFFWYHQRQCGLQASTKSRPCCDNLYFSVPRVKIS